MTSDHVLAQSEIFSLTTVQKASIGVSAVTLLGWCLGLVTLPVVVVVGGLSIALGAIRWRGEWLGELLVRAVRFQSRSRFSSVACEVVGDDVLVTCRGQRTVTLWRSEHRGRLDLRDAEQSQWRRVLQRIEASVVRGETPHLSFHICGHDTWLATSRFELSAPWVKDSSQVLTELPRWVYESWNEMQTEHSYFRVFDIRNFTRCSESVIDVLTDPQKRWSLHGHFQAMSHREALRRTRRDRHAADAAMAWRGLRGVVSPATLAELRLARQHHEENVARGAALIDFRLCVVARAASPTELNEVSSALRDRATRAGVVLRIAAGEQAPALIASWPGPPTW